MKKLFILALLAGSSVMASAQYSLEVTHKSEFKPDNLENVYTNVVKVTKSGGNFTAGDKFTVTRKGSNGSQNISVTVMPSSQYIIGTATSKKYPYSGNTIEVADNFSSSTKGAGGDLTGSYVYSLNGNSVEIPVYSASISAKLVNDYSEDDVLADTEGTLPEQECAITRSSGADWMMYKVDDEDQSFVVVNGLSDKDIVSLIEQTYAGAVVNGENTYGSNSSSIYPGIVSYEASPEKSAYSYTSDGKKYRYYKVPLNLYFEYMPATEASDGGWSIKSHGTPTIQSEELTGGFRVWRKIGESGAETLVFDNVGEDNVANKLVDGYYYKSNVASDEFAAVVDSEMTLRVRAYYYMDKEENNSYGAPAHHAPAVKDEQEKRFYISEVVYKLQLDDITDGGIHTGVDDLNAGKQVSSVKYYNVAGVESAEAFDGMNIVVTRYTDGTTATSKVIR